MHTTTKLSSLYEAFIEAALQNPSHIAVASFDRGKIVSSTYSILQQRVQEKALLFKKQGLCPHMRVALIGENTEAWLITFFAILACDAVVIILDASLEKNDYQTLLNEAYVNGVIASEIVRHKLNALAYPLLKLEEEKPISAFFSKTAHDKPSFSVVLYTSGTTGTFKGVKLSAANLQYAIQAARKVSGLQSSDRVLCLLPLHHVFGLVCATLAPLLSGASILLIDKSQSNLILQGLRQYQCTLLPAVPRLLELFNQQIKTQFQILSSPIRFYFKIALFLSGYLKLPSKVRYLLFHPIHRAFGGHLRLFISGGASLDARIYNNLRQFGFNIIEGYGLTETSGLVAVNPRRCPKAGTVGKTISGTTVRLKSQNAEGVGEILIQGPGIMQGYLNDKRATEAALKEGWLHTGDMGTLDQDGYLCITGRLKELIIRANGEKVMPQDVERRYQEIAGIQELAIVGLPDQQYGGEAVHAAIVPTSRDEKTEANIREHILKRSASVPSALRIQGVHFVQELPKTSTLKFKRALIQRQLLADLPICQSTSDLFSHDDPVTDIVYQLIQKIVAANPSLTLHSQMSFQLDLGLDSLQQLELAEAIQKEFQMQFPIQHFASLMTIDQLIGFIRTQQNDHVQNNLPDTRLLIPLEKPSRRVIALQEMFFSMLSFLFKRYFRLHTQGKEYLPQKGPYLICANHVSHLDSVALLLACGRSVSNTLLAAAKDYHFSSSFKSKMTRCLFNLIPFDRYASMKSIADALQHCQTAINTGASLIIFPEGTRSERNTLQPFKSAAAVIARHLDLPIVPAYIQGTFECLPKGKKWPRRGNIHVRFGQPLQMTNYPSQTAGYKHILNDLFQAIYDLKPSNH